MDSKQHESNKSSFSEIIIISITIVFCVCVIGYTVIDYASTREENEDIMIETIKPEVTEYRMCVHNGYNYEEKYIDVTRVVTHEPGVYTYCLVDGTQLHVVNGMLVNDTGNGVVVELRRIESIVCVE